MVEQLCCRPVCPVDSLNDVAKMFPVFRVFRFAKGKFAFGLHDRQGGPDVVRGFGDERLGLPQCGTEAANEAVQGLCQRQKLNRYIRRHLAKVGWSALFHIHGEPINRPDRQIGRQIGDKDGDQKKSQRDQ